MNKVRDEECGSDCDYEPNEDEESSNSNNTDSAISSKQQSSQMTTIGSPLTVSIYLPSLPQECPPESFTRD